MNINSTEMEVWISHTCQVTRREGHRGRPNTRASVVDRKYAYVLRSVEALT